MRGSEIAMDGTGHLARFTGCFLVFLESPQLVIFPFGGLELGPVSVSRPVYLHGSTISGKGSERESQSVNGLNKLKMFGTWDGVCISGNVNHFKV